MILLYFGPILFGSKAGILFKESLKKAYMNPILLVHGGWHARWCWQRLIPYLEKAGRKVLAPSLPGHEVPNDSLERMTLENYVEAICDLVRQEPDPIVLVGHSMGGLVISQVAERFPHQIRKLVYLAAFLPQNGQCLMDLIRPQLHSPASFEISSDGLSAVMSKEKAQEKFYADCPKEIAEWAINQLIPQALSPFRSPVFLTKENFGRIPKIYIECTQDQSIWLQTQRSMHALADCERIYQMPTGHAPFLSQPKELASYLTMI